MQTAIRSLAAALLLVVPIQLAGPRAQAQAVTDPYSAALTHSGRSNADITRDATDHPAEILRLARIRPGMHVADYLAGDGYYSELLSYIVGPKGKVLLLNNKEFDAFTSDHWKDRLRDNRLPNVEHLTIDVQHPQLAPHSLDAVLMIKVYHDLYWVDPSGKDWPKIDPQLALHEIAKALKPGGVLLLVDHSARAGSGSADASTLHRIDEDFARRDLENQGFTLMTHSDLLRRPADSRNEVSYKAPILGKTDRFVLVFRRK